MTDLDRYVVSGEVLPQSYTRPQGHELLHQRITNAANLYVHGVQELGRFDSEVTNLTDSKPWISRYANECGTDLGMHIRSIVGQYLNPRW